MLKNKILTTALSVSLLAPLVNPLLESAKAANDTEDISKGSDIEVIKRTEDKTSNKWGVTQNIQFDLVKDKKYNGDTSTLKTQGFISSRTTYYNYKRANHAKAVRQLFQYNIGLRANDKYISLINYLPKNKTESTNMSQALGYNIGGNFQSAPPLDDNRSFNYSKSISYTQQNHISEVEQQSSKGVLWGVRTDSFATESDQESAFDSDLFIGYKPYSKDPRDYLAPDSKLPPLVQSGFNPSSIATVSHEKGSSDTNEFEITYGRNMDVTHATRRPTHHGDGYLDGYKVHNAFVSKNYIVRYEVSWKTHKIKVKGQN